MAACSRLCGNALARLILLTGLVLTLAGAFQTVSAAETHGGVLRALPARRLLQDQNSTQNSSAAGASSNGTQSQGGSDSALAATPSPPPAPLAFQCWGSTLRVESIKWATSATAVDCSAVATPSPSSSGTASSAGGNDGSASNGTSASNSTGAAGAGNSTAGRRLLQDNATSASGSANGTTAGQSGAPAFSTWTGADDGCVTRDEYKAMFGSDTSAPPFDSKAGLGDDNLKCISQADEDVWLQQKFCVQYTATVDGSSYTAGGCLSQVAQGALAQIKCDYDGQRSTISLPFMGQGDPVQLTVFCCMTSLCNKCSNGLAIVAPPPPSPAPPTAATPAPSPVAGGPAIGGGNSTGGTGGNTSGVATGGANTTTTSERRLLQDNSTGDSAAGAGNATAGSNGTSGSGSGGTSASSVGGSNAAGPAPLTGINRDVYTCTAAPSPPPPPAPAPKPPPDIGSDMVLLAFESFTLPSADVLATQGFTFMFSDPAYAGLGASIPPGAWPPGDTRAPSLAIYQASDSHLQAKSDMEGSELAGLLIDFQPSPITFLAAVTVALPVDDIQTNVSYSAAMFDEENLTWVMKPVSDGKDAIVNGTVQGETMSFSLYAALSYPSPSGCNTACIIGAVIGGVVGLLCCCGIAYYLYSTSEQAAASADGNAGEEEEEEQQPPPPKTRDIPAGREKKDDDVEAGPVATAAPAPEPKPYRDISGGEDEEDEDGEHVYDV